MTPQGSLGVNIKYLTLCLSSLSGLHTSQSLSHAGQTIGCQPLSSLTLLLVFQQMEDFYFGFCGVIVFKSIFVCCVSAFFCEQKTMIVHMCTLT